MIPTILIPALLAGAPAHEIAFEAPAVHVAGQPFTVTLTIDADGPVEAWRLGPAAFEVNGMAVAERGDDTVELPRGASLALEFDLGPHLPGAGDFQLGCAGSDEVVPVSVFDVVERGAKDFLDMAPDELAKHKALLVTNRGTILLEMWPQHAPNHVRNFLDLVNTGFYEGILFHRVSPTFMIQGGCPNTKTQPMNRSSWGFGSGPRTLPAEFSDTVKHVTGVLSMGRGPSPDSASSQFFIMTRPNPGLDGKYSAFGKVLDGMETVMRIANAKGERSPRDGTIKPTEPQRIERTYVLKPE